MIWSVGFTGDYGWLRVPGAIDRSGAPVQSRCLSVPGVYFPGLDSLESLKSGTVMVVGEESDRIVADMLARG